MLYVVVDMVASGCLFIVAFMFAWHSFEICFLLKVLVSVGFSLNLVLVWSITGAQAFWICLVQETVNCLIVFHGIIHAIGWAMHSTWHSWVCILPKYIFLAVALNDYSYYSFSAAVNQYCQILLMQLYCWCNYAVVFKSRTEGLESVKLTVKIREHLLEESENLDN